LILRDAGLRREQRRAEARAVEVVGPRVVEALEETLDPSALAGIEELRSAVPQTLWCAQKLPSRFLQTTTERPATSTTR
jgi:hypothetical protein